MNKYYINHTVSIADGSVSVNGEQAFSVEKNEPLGAFLKQVYKNYEVGYSKYFKMDKLSKLGFLCSEVLFQQLGESDLKDEETAIVFANSAASLHTDHNFQQTIEDIPSPSVFVYTLANIVIGEVCIKNNIKGETAFFVQEKFDVDFMSEYVNIVLSTTQAKQCVLAWGEVDAHENYKATVALVSDKINKQEFNTERLQNIFN